MLGHGALADLDQGQRAVLVEGQLLGSGLDPPSGTAVGLVAERVGQLCGEVGGQLGGQPGVAEQAQRHRGRIGRGAALGFHDVTSPAGRTLWAGARSGPPAARAPQIGGFSAMTSTGSMVGWANRVSVLSARAWATWPERWAWRPESSGKAS